MLVASIDAELVPREAPPDRRGSSPMQLDGVVGEEAELAVLVEGAEQKATYAGFDEGPWPCPNMEQLR